MKSTATLLHTCRLLCPTNTSIIDVVAANTVATGAISPAYYTRLCSNIALTPFIAAPDSARAVVLSPVPCVENAMTTVVAGMCMSMCVCVIWFG